MLSIARLSAAPCSGRGSRVNVTRLMVCLQLQEQAARITAELDAALGRPSDAPRSASAPVAAADGNSGGAPAAPPARAAGRQPIAAMSAEVVHSLQTSSPLFDIYNLTFLLGSEQFVFYMTFSTRWALLKAMEHCVCTPAVHCCWQKGVQKSLNTRRSRRLPHTPHVCGFRKGSFKARLSLSQVVDSNPYSRLMALQRMGIVKDYERIRDKTVRDVCLAT